MRPLWRRLFDGDVSPGWLRRGTGRDQPGTNGDHGDHGDRDEARPAVLTRDHEPTRSLMPDRPIKPEVHWRDRERKPLVPETYKRDHIRFALDHAWWVIKFHRNRIPLYLAQNAVWSLRGVGRLATGMVRWARIQDERERLWAVEGQASRGEESWLTVERMDRSRRDRARARTALVMVGTAGAAVLAFVGLTNPLTLVPTLLVLVFGLGWAGRPMDRPWVESAVVSTPQARKITPDMVIAALLAAGLCKETTGPHAPEFVGAQWGRVDQGWGGVVDLPPGTTAEQAIGRKTRLAAALRVDEFRLFIDQERGERGHAGQIRIWIADRDPHTRDPVTSPLVKAREWSLWNEVPFGQDERGRAVSLTMIWTSFLFGALPRMGKTAALRLLVAATALDTYARLLLFDGKGGKDFAAAEQVAHAFGAGPDDEVAKALVVALRELQSDMRRRFKVLRSLPDEVCREGKLTKALSRDPKLNMPVVVVAIDEFQVYLENRKHGNEILELLTSLAKVGPAAGIILALATQRPSSTVMKTDFRDVIGVRFAMRCTTREFSEMILGSGSYKAGLDASKFLASHKGVGVLLGTDDGPLADKGGQTVHAHLIDLPQFSAICERSRALREGAGTLSGVAAGEENEALSDRILAHVVKAFRGDDKAHSDVLCARMADDYPGLYEDWDPTDLAAALNRFGIRGRNQIWAPRLEDGEGANRRGFSRQQVEEAARDRLDPLPESPPDDL